MKMKIYLLTIFFGCAVLYGVAHIFNTVQPSSKITITTVAYNPTKGVEISYPQINGCENNNIEQIINQFLESAFISLQQQDIDEVVDENINERGIYQYHADFKAEQIHNLLIVEEHGYVYCGGAHGMPHWLTYHIDLKTGQRYSFKDLFKHETDYLVHICKIVNDMRLQLRQQNEYYFNDNEIQEITDNCNFMITQSGVKIFFFPYEIACYAAGFPEFDISFELLSGYLDTQGAFYAAFKKGLSKKNSKDGVSFKHPHDNLY